MEIEFLCPNGHKIRCGEERAGRAAKCPKCGEKFLVPELAEIRVSQGTDVPQPPEVDSDLIGPPPEEPEQIQFLCPNGHQLSAEPEAQGTPGQCPHCGSKFHVPRLEEAASAVIDRASPIAVPPAVGDGGEAYEAILVDDPTPSAGLPEPSSDLMAAIWREKNVGAVVELQLADGETLVPDHYSPSLSGGSHALFAVSAPDGSYTLTAVAWDTIKRIRATGVKRLPEGF